MVNMVEMPVEATPREEMLTKEGMRSDVNPHRVNHHHVHHVHQGTVHHHHVHHVHHGTVHHHHVHHGQTTREVAIRIRIRINSLEGDAVAGDVTSTAADWK